MGVTRARHGESAGRFDPKSDSRTKDVGGHLDEATRGRVQLVCDFVNAEITRWRYSVIAVGVACLVGMALLPLVGISDMRVRVVIAAGILGFWFVRARRELASSYHNIAAKRLVAATSKALTYKRVSSVTREQFVSLDLFAMPGKRWQSVHEIGGRAGQTAFSLHAVDASGTERGAAVFRGVIIRLESAASFPGHTVVLPERHGEITGASAASGRGAKRDLVLLKSPEFERLFSVYSTDYSQARRLFTPKFMEAIIAATEILGSDIRLAFVNRSLFVAVPDATLLPEVSLFSAPLTPEHATGQIVRLAGFADGLARVVASE